MVATLRAAQRKDDLTTCDLDKLKLSISLGLYCVRARNAIKPSRHVAESILCWGNEGC